MPPANHPDRVRQSFSYLASNPRSPHHILRPSLRPPGLNTWGRQVSNVTSKSYPCLRRARPVQGPRAPVSQSSQEAVWPQDGQAGGVGRVVGPRKSHYPKLTSTDCFLRAGLRPRACHLVPPPPMMQACSRNLCLTEEKQAQRG